MKLNLINPKMWVFYLSVLPIFVKESGNVFLQLIWEKNNIVYMEIALSLFL